MNLALKGGPPAAPRTVDGSGGHGCPPSGALRIEPVGGRLEVPEEGGAEPALAGGIALHLVPVAPRLLVEPSQRHLRSGERVFREDQVESSLGPLHGDAGPPEFRIDDLGDASDERFLDEVGGFIVEDPHAMVAVGPDHEDAVVGNPCGGADFTEPVDHVFLLFCSGDGCQKGAARPARKPVRRAGRNFSGKMVRREFFGKSSRG